MDSRRHPPQPAQYFSESRRWPVADKHRINFEPVDIEMEVGEDEY
ncbi:MAG: CDP-6-deoxy-delta-3,4-glucoseen reductase, partial [Rhodococcus sp. (in: high G+C Gram-positive bacteria)]